MGKKLRDLHNQKMKADPGYKAEYEALEDEFKKADESIKACSRASSTPKPQTQS